MNTHLGADSIAAPLHRHEVREVFAGGLRGRATHPPERGATVRGEALQVHHLLAERAKREQRACLAHAGATADDAHTGAAIVRLGGEEEEEEEEEEGATDETSSDMLDAREDEEDARVSAAGGVHRERTHRRKDLYPPRTTRASRTPGGAL